MAAEQKGATMAGQAGDSALSTSTRVPPVTDRLAHDLDAPLGVDFAGDHDGATFTSSVRRGDGLIAVKTVCAAGRERPQAGTGTAGVPQGG